MTAGWTADERVAAHLNHYLEPGGKHTWDVGDACRSFDGATYGNALFARFFALDRAQPCNPSHPASHRCLATGTCPFLRQSPRRVSTARPSPDRGWTPA